MPYSVYTMAALALLLIALSLNISRLRLAHKVSFGDGGIKELTVAVRAHGNSLEQSLFFALLLYIAETSAHLDGVLVLLLGCAFIALRIVYCGAMFTRRLLVRQVAHALTMLLQLATTVLLVLRH